MMAFLTLWTEDTFYPLNSWTLTSNTVCVSNGSPSQMWTIHCSHDWPKCQPCSGNRSNINTLWHWWQGQIWEKACVVCVGGGGCVLCGGNAQTFLSRVLLPSSPSGSTPRQAGAKLRPSRETQGPAEGRPLYKKHKGTNIQCPLLHPFRPEKVIWLDVAKG